MGVCEFDINLTNLLNYLFNSYSLRSRSNLNKLSWAKYRNTTTTVAVRSEIPPITAQTNIYIQLSDLLILMLKIGFSRMDRKKRFVAVVC